MRRKKVKTNYERLKMDELHTLAGKVLACMKESTIFTDIPMDIEDLETTVQEFQHTWEVAKDGGSKLDRSYRDDARDTLLETFSILATYVNQTAKGSVSMLLSSGFDLEQDSKATQVPPPPGWVRLQDGPQKQQLLLRFAAVTEALFYEYQYADALDEQGEPVWGEMLQTGKSTNNIIAPTRPGVMYHARVRTRNGKGASDWSDSISLLAR